MKKSKMLFSMLLSAAILGSVFCVAGCNNPPEYTEVSSKAEIENILNDTTSAEKTHYLKLTDNITMDIVIGKTQKVVLDLNGKNIQNETGHTILNNGTLTIENNVEAAGKVINNTNQKASLINSQGATLNVKGGTFVRETDLGVGTNSYYVFLNQGNAEINGGSFLNVNGKDSSLINNGWYNPNENTAKINANLVINNGYFEGGKYIKNDDYGVMTINNGTFKNKNEALLLNWNELTVNGGSFVADKCACFLFMGSKGNEVYEKANAVISSKALLSGTITNKSAYQFVASSPELKGTITGDISVSEDFHMEYEEQI